MPPQRRTSSAPQIPSQQPPQTPTEFLQSHIRHRTTHLLNPTIDRIPAQIHIPDNSKLTIHINQPDNRVSVSTYGSAVNWSDRVSVNGLNEWRNWVFGHWFGAFGAPAARRAENVKYCDEEKEWLKRTCGGKRVASWEGVAERFSARFEGVVLEGHTQPRPKRTANNLKALYYGMTKKEARELEVEATESELTEAEPTVSAPTVIAPTVSAPTASASTVSAPTVSEPTETGQDDSSEMDEWELDIILRFGETVRQMKEEMRQKAAIAKKRNLRYSGAF